MGESADRSAELFAAIQAGDSDQVRQLVAEDSKLASAVNEQGLSALMWALYTRQQPIADNLAAVRIEAGVPLTLHEASAMGDLARVREHLAFGNDLAEFSVDGFTSLHLAAFFGRETVAPVLLDYGAAVAVAAGNPSGVHPLHSAAATGSVEICRLLLERGAEVDAQQHGGFTAMMSAALHGNVALVELLLEHGADLSLESDEGKTALDMAGEGGHEVVAERLRAAG